MAFVPVKDFDDLKLLAEAGLLYCRYSNGWAAEPLDVLEGDLDSSSDGGSGHFEGHPRDWLARGLYAVAVEE